VLANLSVQNFRCIETAALDFDARGTGIVGPNGAGKTSLLEAIYFLAHGRSFRTAQRGKLVGPAPTPTRVVGSLNVGGRTLVAGVELFEGSTQARLGGESVSGISDIAEVMPVQVIDPGVHRLIEEGSARRRRQLDWGVFHVKHDFLVPWRRYQRALVQRNAALRSIPSQARIWDQELDACAGEIDRQREGYASELTPAFAALASDLLGRACEVRYLRGWDSELPLRGALDRSWDRDSRIGVTTVGPHRADLVFRVEGQLARDRISRGQQKVLASAFVLCQLILLAPRIPHPACLLLDDPAAELDVDSLGKILGAIQKVPAQLIVTSLSLDGLRGIEIGRRFHVEQGRFTAML
jgi:DNA replication and repair protein RecF